MVICATANQVNCHDIGSSIFTLSTQPQFQNHFRCQGAEFHESSPDFARNPSAAGAVATCHPSLQLGISVQHHLPRKHLRHHGSPQWYKRRIKEPFRTTFLNQRCVACENSKEYSCCNSNLYNKSVLWIMKKNVVWGTLHFSSTGRTQKDQLWWMHLPCSYCISNI